MLIKSKRASDVLPSEITSESVYLKRRDIIKTSLAAGTLGTFGISPTIAQSGVVDAIGSGLASVKKTAYGQDETLTPLKDVLRYNNFYEFGTDKGDPAKYAHEMTIDPWSVTVEGHADNVGTFALEDLLKPLSYEERVYRFRCVEAWSMVIPWVGFELGTLLKRFKPTSKAKYVFFETLYRPDEMRGQQSSFSSIDWPYVEGLRMDEAMHPLTFMAVGVYGKPMANQNGAPFRLVVPWKYGFKSIKSIVKIRFLEERVQTSWEKTAPQEYGFYSNVNPQVDHPRWSQKEERRLPSGFFTPKIPTQMLNGYADEVAGLYANMDLKKFY